VAVELLGGEVGEWLCFGIILFAEGASGGGESQRNVTCGMSAVELGKFPFRVLEALAT
jgi:hypothetical protein